MINIYWLELFLTVMQGDIGDAWRGRGSGNEVDWSREKKLIYFKMIIWIQSTKYNYYKELMVSI